MRFKTTITTNFFITIITLFRSHFDEGIIEG